MSSKIPGVILLGRPNVGKSTLFNRLIGSNRAITHDRAGITRDRLEGIVRQPGRPPYEIVDTGGVTLAGSSELAEGPEGIRGFEKEILAQAEAAMAEACAIAFVVDGQVGLLPQDEYLAELIRKKNLPVLCVVNKIDGPEREDALLGEFYSLGFPLLAVSAEHGYNIGALREDLASLLPGDQAVEPDAPSLRLAMLGRPNAGKSSLINALSGQDRLIVSDVAGTTRDSVDVRFAWKGKDYVFVDTAGIRRRARVTDSVEKFSVNSAIKSTTKADVTLVVIDAAEGVSQQDKRLVDLLVTRKIPFMILLNKCDLFSPAELKKIKKDAAELLGFCRYVPILEVSANSGAGLGKILPLAQEIKKECGLRVGTGQLNRAMEEALARHQPPMVRRRRPKFFYMTQAESEPPTFVFFVSDAASVPPAYERYLESAIRHIFGIKHAPIRIHLRSSHKKNERPR